MTAPRLLGRFVVVPAAYVFLMRHGSGGPEVLLQLRQNTGFMDGHWAAAAAGHVEQGETAYDAAHREALEELGLSDVELEFVTSMQRTRSGEPIDERIDFFFTARRWSGEPRALEPEKCADLRWCALDALDALPEPVVPHERVVLEAIRAGTTTPYTTFGFDTARGAQMGDELPTQSGDLGPQPEPETEPGDENPGGADALPDNGPPEPADLAPEDNPAVEDHDTEGVLREMREPEDTDTEATKEGTDVPPERESPA